MRRNIDKLASRRYDLLVVGGGIQGACVAREASEAGLSVALIDRSDFGAATSHNSLKLVHAGFRYLQHANIGRVRQSALDTRRWLKSAPGFIKPLRFVIPIYGYGLRGREASYIAAKAYSMLTFDRNSGLAEAARLSDGEILSRSKLLDRVPELPTRGLRGGLIWWDGQLQDADRILIRMISRAVDCGADVANYLEAIRLRRTPNVVEGVEAIDRVSGRELTIRSKMTIVCCGPWSRSFLDASEVDISRRLAPNLLKGVNVVIRGRRFDFGLGVSSQHTSDALLGSSKRIYLVTPWHDCSIIGTANMIYGGHPNDFHITANDVSSILEEMNEAYPPLALSIDDVLYCYGGLTPCGDRGDSAGLSSHESAVVDHRHTDRIHGLMTVAGVKWTTAWSLAQRAVKAALRYFPEADISRTQSELFDETEYAHYAAALSNNDLTASIIEAANNEMAVNLSDALLRRTSMIARGKLSETDLEQAIATMASVHGWSNEEIRRQRSNLDDELNKHRCYLSVKKRSPSVAFQD